jgi:hypothetical protein
MKAKKKAPKKKPAAKKKVAVKKGPRQKSLPGMEDRKITALDNAALSYDEVKKQRMELTEREVEAKELVRSLMHKEGKKAYKHNGITITLEPEGEKVKVKVKAAGEEDDEDESAVTVSVGDGEPNEDEFAEEHEEADSGDYEVDNP